MEPTSPCPERYAKRVAFLERMRALGWKRFTTRLLLLGIFGITALLYVTVGLGWMLSKPLEIACAFAGVLAYSQIVWCNIPVSIDWMREPSRTRQYLYREGNLIETAGLLALLFAGMLPLHLGREAAGADLMLTISGIVLAGWGVTKVYRFWTESSNWNALSVGQRIVRLYANLAIACATILASVVRVYAYYGDAPWAEPVRRLIGP